MNRRKPLLPPRESVRVYGHGKARAVRLLYVERASLLEIREALGVSGEFVSRALRWKKDVRLWE